MTEWTGYLTAVTNAGIIFYLARKNKNNKLYWLTFGIIFSSVIAIILFLLHFIWVAGAENTIYALSRRFFARSGLRSTPFHLGYGHIMSYGILPLVATISTYIIWRYRNAIINKRVIVLMLIASSTPLLENFLLMNHAYSYSFDRLKAIVPMMLLIALSIHIAKIKIRILLTSLLIIGLISNLVIFQVRAREIDVSVALKNNKLLLDQLPSYSEPCVLYALNSSVRGWVNLSLNRGVFEGIKNADQLKSLVVGRKACAGVLLNVKSTFLISNVYEYAGAIVYDPNTDSFQNISVANIK